MTQLLRHDTMSGDWGKLPKAIRGSEYTRKPHWTVQENTESAFAFKDNIYNHPGL